MDNTILKSIAASAATTIIILAIAAGIVKTNAPALRSWLGQAPAASYQTPAANNDSIVAAVKKANPAVVSIIITKDEPIVQRYYSSPDFLDFFGFTVPQYRQEGTRKVEVGGGSGFFVSADGLIVTNKHVVSETDAEYTVYTNDGKKHAAKVIALDPVEDIAIMKVTGNNFPFLTFGSSKDLALGQSVIAIGNSLGEFRNTVSVGVISGLSRSIVAGSSYGASEALNEVIQTDAAINLGNSGGPLLDLNGNVIGVNVAVAAGSQNIGFALPADSVMAAVQSVKKQGKIVRPYLGIRYTSVTESLKSQRNLSVDYGALVISGGPGEPAVAPGSPAAKAGIVEGDVLLTFDGSAITQDKPLATHLRLKNAGDIAALTVLHNGAQKTVTVTLEEFPDN